MTAVGCALLAPTASARWYGSKLKGKPNATFGCGSAIQSGLYGPQLTPTGHRSCTYRHGGYLYSNRFTFLAPGTGRVTRIRVKSGSHPAKLRLTVLTGSSRVSPYTGQDVPNTYTCCTARYVGRGFRPRANRITKKRVNVRVYDVRSKAVEHRLHSTDGLALTAVGSGTLPLHIGQVGGYDPGTPLAVGYWPRTRKGDPRVEVNSTTGVDLLFQWNFKRRRGR